MWVQSLGWEDPLEEGMEIHPVFLPVKSHNREVWWAIVHRVAKSQTQLKWLSTHAHVEIYIGHPSFCFSKQLMKSLDHMFNIKNRLSSFVSHFYKWCKYLLLHFQFYHHLIFSLMIELLDVVGELSFYGRLHSPQDFMKNSRQ